MSKEPTPPPNQSIKPAPPPAPPPKINGGGPAFPRSYSRAERPDGRLLYEEEAHKGMTLREYYAGLALAGLSANELAYEGMTYEQQASACFSLADAIIAELEKENDA